MRCSSLFPAAFEISFGTVSLAYRASFSTVLNLFSLLTSFLAKFFRNSIPTAPLQDERYSYKACSSGCHFELSYPE
ncbi:hypothetical protein [Xenorhabdus sp. NBAII XenSa04]|uniref:hypothetical protein n=1 Tax=Xenorhabdus sp. NBAII XenSa04 TaxID=1429873 RepID=UPI0009077E83|nr:hypothetical protein [Xenorhabdus sp. NBAII XenSa04]